MNPMRLFSAAIAVTFSLWHVAAQAQDFGDPLGNPSLLDVIDNLEGEDDLEVELGYFPTGSGLQNLLRAEISPRSPDDDNLNEDDGGITIEGELVDTELGSGLSLSIEWAMEEPDRVIRNKNKADIVQSKYLWIKIETSTEFQLEEDEFPANPKQCKASVSLDGKGKAPVGIGFPVNTATRARWTIKCKKGWIDAFGLPVQTRQAVLGVLGQKFSIHAKSSIQVIDD